MLQQTIVVAEDERAIRDLVTHHLEREGFTVVGASDGNTALRHARNVADLLVLDVGLPGIGGHDVARSLRREGLELPIVMLTARTEEVDRIVGFELGADDYVCKPFSPHELVARVKAVLRRKNDPHDNGSAPLRFDRLEIDERAREARVDGERVKLTPREFELLLELARNPGVAFSRDRILQKIWGYDYSGDPRTVDVHVHRLREKLETKAGLPQLIFTVHRFGYKFLRV